MIISRYSVLTLAVSVSLTVFSIAQDSSDDALTAFWIKQALQDDPRVDADEIIVEFENGATTLKGHVRSLLQLEFASSIVRRIYGVRSVSNELNVRTKGRSDEVVAEEIRERFRISSAMRNAVVGVNFSDGVATLSGSVALNAQRGEAVWLAREVPGVVAVRNNIDVRFEVTVDVNEVQEEVKGILDNDLFLAELPVAISVEAGVVTIGGRVPSAWQKRRAETLAASLRRVARVENQLIVDSDAGRDSIVLPDDDELTELVEQRLRIDTRIRAADLHVSSVDGVITLRGSVPTQHERNLAEQTVRDVRGVISLSNLMTVRPGTRLDSDILSDIKLAFRTDSALRGRAITAMCSAGSVRLSGEVEAFFIKARAADVAGRVRGVKDVRNEISVVPARLVSDLLLKQRIDSRLTSHAMTRNAAARITVAVRNGVATLTGDVSHVAARREATRTTASTAGVRQVVNRLTVNGRAYPPENLRSGPEP